MYVRIIKQSQMRNRIDAFFEALEHRKLVGPKTVNG